MTEEAPLKTSPASRKRRRILIALSALLAALVLITSMLVGASAGYQQGLAEARATGTISLEQVLSQQIQLGELDFQAGKYDVARQRLEFVLAADPDFPGANEKLAAILAVLNARATPSATATLTPTPTLTPTADIRPVENRLLDALRQATSGNWDAVISVLTGLRNDSPNFEPTSVDGLLYLALRYRGVDKIYQTHDLAGGIYDLSLAENFGPLDLEADTARNVARLYLIGSGFWEAYPEQAVFFFAQVAAAAPYLRDASGWTATERYRGALIQYGDQLGRSGEWCAALEQYQLAAAIRSDAALEANLQKASEMCLPPTALPSATASQTFTPTPTLLTPSPSASAVPPSETPTPTEPPAPSSTPEPPTPTDTVPPPTDTPAPPGLVARP